MTVALAERVLGCHGAGLEGPLVVTIAALHGNEPAGIPASHRVLERLKRLAVPFRGGYLALAGNRAALAAGQRFLDEDLNRIWLAPRIEACLQGADPTTVEAGEQRELLEEIQRALHRFGGPAFFLDLHTTSAPGAPFAIFSDTLANRRLASRLPGTMVLGLEEHLEGTLLSYINDLGHIAVGFEGGQHEARASIDAHELAIWKTLAAAGCLRPSDVPAPSIAAEALLYRARALPRTVEIRYRHAVDPDDRFQMMPGFLNLQRVVRGQALARDRNGEIRSSEGGCILMPLYQSQGNDGFFITRQVPSGWLVVSAWMRRLRLDRLLRFMPGVRPHPDLEDAYVIDRRLARWFLLDFCHLLGFRRKSSEGDSLIVTRRQSRPVNGL